MALNPCAKFEVGQFDGADEVMYHVMDLTSPTEVWETLVKRFMSKSLTNRLYLKQRLYCLKMQESTDLQQHLNTFNQVINDLQKLDVKTQSLDEITYAHLSHTQRRQNVEGSRGDGLYVKGSQARGRRQGVMTVMKGKRIVGNTYKLLGRTVVCGVDGVTEEISVDSDHDTTKLWHIHLGHISVCGMTEQCKIGLLREVSK
ncbi:hypothetical protein Lal_00047805 [Lupinus albus]|nr:hypothetical protein Lal_00047805 [Lupinus albus]